MRNQQAMIRRVAHQKMSQVNREGGAVKDFFKGIVYDDWEIAIHNLVEKAVYKSGDLNLIPLKQVPSTIPVDQDQVFVDGRGSKFVIALDESIPLVGLSFLMKAEELLNRDKHSRSLKKMMEDRNLKVYTPKDLIRKLERQGFKDLIKTANQNYLNDTPDQKRGKVTHLLSIIKDSGVISGNDLEMVEDMIELLTSSFAQGKTPIRILSEPQARYLRKIIFRNYSKYKSQVPSLPPGIDFNDEVRRLLKGGLSPNDEKKRAKEGMKVVRQEIDRFFRSIGEQYHVQLPRHVVTVQNSLHQGWLGYQMDVNGRLWNMAIAVDGMKITKVVHFNERVDISTSSSNVDRLLNDPSKHIKL